MCGIVGIVEYHQPLRPEQLKAMTDRLAHRGPDASEIKIWDLETYQLGFGHRRLSIIDTSDRGLQPMSNEQGTIWLIFNGEIYNYKELREELRSLGHVFKSDADSEVIIHAYESFGPDCVNHLRGMFAFAIYDEPGRSIFGARDRFGIKPLYFYHHDHRFLFASEIKALLLIDGIDTTFDPEAIDYYFCYGHIGTDASVYKHIRKILPGHAFTYDLETGSLQQTQYWSVNYAVDEELSADEWCDRLTIALDDSVQHHMISDVPLGAFLSGGLDSSVIVAKMAMLSSVPVKTFSIGFIEEEYNELYYARLIAERYETDHHELVVEPQSIDILPKLVEAYDEPFADSSALPTYLLSKFASETVKVVLSGDGGDELFAGYGSYKRILALARMRLNNVVLRKTIWPLLNRIYPRNRKGRDILYLLAQDTKDFGTVLAAWPTRDRVYHYNSDFAAALSSSTAETKQQEFHQTAQDEDLLHSLLHLGIRTSMVDGVLTKVDRASMQHSLEVRVPLLDHEFAELTFRIPSSLKLRRNIEKYIFKRMSAQLLPPENIHRSKQGFRVPLDSWFKSDLYDFFSDTISSSSNGLEYFLNLQNVSTLFTAHKKGQRNLSNRLWRILFFSQWLEQHGQRAGN